jgi:ribosome-binding factor A
MSECQPDWRSREVCQGRAGGPFWQPRCSLHRRFAVPLLSLTRLTIMANQLRQKRVADRIRSDLSDLFSREMSDPRLKLVTVTNVLVDRELAYANIWVCRADGDPAEDEVMAALEGARGFLRRELAARVQLRHAPQLVFHWDHSPDHAERMAHLLDELKQKPASGGNPPHPQDGEA